MRNEEAYRKVQVVHRHLDASEEDGVANELPDRNAVAVAVQEMFPGCAAAIANPFRLAVRIPSLHELEIQDVGMAVPEVVHSYGSEWWETRAVPLLVCQYFFKRRAGEPFAPFTFWLPHESKWRRA